MGGHMLQLISTQSCVNNTTSEQMSSKTKLCINNRPNIFFLQHTNIVATILYLYLHIDLFLRIRNIVIPFTRFQNSSSIFGTCSKIAHLFDFSICEIQDTNYPNAMILSPRSDFLIKLQLTENRIDFLLFSAILFQCNSCHLLKEQGGVNVGKANNLEYKRSLFYVMNVKFDFRL